MPSIRREKLLQFVRFMRAPSRIFLMGLLFLLIASNALPASAAINTGTFAPKIDFATNLGPTGIAQGDLDGDGKPDIAVANYGTVATIGNTVSVLRNTSSGGNVSFAGKVDFATNNGPHYVAIGDLDGDGKLDLVTSNYDAFAVGRTVSILRNTSTPGNLAFAPKVDLTAGIGPVQVVMGDLDGDGKPDLAVTNFNDGNGTTVSVFRNTSTSGTIAFEPKIDFTTGAGPYGLTLRDLDGDGKRDLATVNFGLIAVGDGNTVSVLRNTSTIGTIAFDAKVDFTVSTGPRSILSADFDGDGKADLATTNFGVGGSNNTVSVLRNTSTTGNVSFAPKLDLTGTAGVLGITSNDFDGDGKLDLAVSNYGMNWPMPMNLGTTVSVFGNTSVSGTLSFTSKVDFGTGAGPHAIVSSDVDQNNKPDLVVVNYGNGDLASASVLQNTTGGVFNTPTSTPTSLYTPTNTPTFTPTALNTPTSTPSVSTPTNTPLPPTPTNTPGSSADVLFDDFVGSGLSSLWFVPWNNAPIISSGLATFNGGNTIESNSTLGNLNVFEMRAQYSLNSYTGLCWTNSGVSNYVCWVPLSTNTSRFAFFTSNSGETDSGIIIPTGYHRYAISRNANLFTVYIDGAPVYSVTNSAVAVDRVYISGYGGLSVDWACVYAIGSSCQGAGAPIPTPTATNTPLPTATNTPLPTATNTPSPTLTNTPLPTATNTPLPTLTNTPLPTATNTPLPTSTNTPLPTATNTPLPTVTNTPLPTVTNTPLPTVTNTPLPTATRTNTPLPTATRTNTPLPTATNTPTRTATPTNTPTRTATPTNTPTRVLTCVNLAPTADTYIAGDRPNNNFGGNTSLRTDSEQTKLLRTLVQFNVSTIPTSIQSATLFVYLSTTSGVLTDQVNAHRVTASWNETQTTWNNRSAGTAWTNPGGDYNSVSEGSFVANGLGWKSLTLNTLAESWRTGTLANYGVILESPARIGNNEKLYTSRESGTATQRPYLRVCYY